MQVKMNGYKSRDTLWFSGIVRILCLVWDYLCLIFPCSNTGFYNVNGIESQDFTMSMAAIKVFKLCIVKHTICHIAIVTPIKNNSMSDADILYVYKKRLI